MLFTTVFVRSIVNCLQVNAITAEVEVDHNGKMDLSQFIVLMHNQVQQMMRRRFGRQSNYFLRMVQFSEKPQN